MQEAEAMLKYLGLTEYEAKAFMTLIKSGRPLNAERVSSLGSIPLPRVYDTMSSLSKRGLISVSKTRPQIFRITDPKHIFDILKEDEKRKMEEKVKSIETIASQFLNKISGISTLDVEETEEIIAQVKRKINIDKIWTDLQRQTKKEFLVFAGDLSWIEKHSSNIRKMIKNGIEYKVIWSKTGNNIIKNVKKGYKLKVELKYNPDVKDLRSIISDGNRIYLIQKDEKDKTYTKFSSIIVSNKIIADVFRNYFYTLWKRGVPAEKFLKKKR